MWRFFKRRGVRKKVDLHKITSYTNILEELSLDVFLFRYIFSSHISLCFANESAIEALATALEYEMSRVKLARISIEYTTPCKREHACVRCVCGRTFPSDSRPKLDRQIETVAYPLLGERDVGREREEKGRSREKRDDQGFLDLCCSRTSLEVSFHRRGHEDTRVPPLVIHVTARPDGV